MTIMTLLLTFIKDKDRFKRQPFRVASRIFSCLGKSVYCQRSHNRSFIRLGLLIFTAEFAGVSASVASDQVIDSLDAIKRSLTRPIATPLPILKDENVTLVAQSEVARLSKYNSLSFSKSEIQAIRDFWSTKTLRALVAVGGSYPRYQHDDHHSAWFSRADVSGGDLGGGALKPSLDERIQLTFLSKDGYQREETSQELVSEIGPERFAGFSVADFCEPRPGSHVPVDFALRFSPWDVAVINASSSRLEASLFNLMRQPDALAIDPDLVQNQAEVSTPNHDHRHVWQETLERLDKPISRQKLRLSDLARIVQRDHAIESSARQIVLGAFADASTLRTRCVRGRGVWEELRWRDRGWLELLSCRSDSQGSEGYSLLVEAGDLVEGSIVFSSSLPGLKIEAFLDADNEELSIRYESSRLALQSMIWLSKDGTVRATKDVIGGLTQHWIYDDQGRVIWANQVSSLSEIRDISWYADGRPKSFSLYDQTGLVGKGGFHSNGRPRYWQPYAFGKKSGDLVWWFSDGHRAGVLGFSGGKRFGVGRIFYENGIEGFSAEYADDQLHGQMSWRDPSGCQGRGWTGLC